MKKLTAVVSMFFVFVMSGLVIKANTNQFSQNALNQNAIKAKISQKAQHSSGFSRCSYWLIADAKVNVGNWTYNMRNGTNAQMRWKNYGNRANLTGNKNVGQAIEFIASGKDPTYNVRKYVTNEGNSIRLSGNIFNKDYVNVGNLNTERLSNFLEKNGGANKLSKINPGTNIAVNGKNYS